MSDEEKYAAMVKFSEDNESLPDGAFFQLAEDVRGWTSKDWSWQADQEEKRAKAKP